MANFGTYEGHKILRQAMDNAIDTVMTHKKDTIAHKRWQMEFDEKKKNDEVLREKTKWDFAKTKKADAKNRLMVDIEKELYKDIQSGDKFTVDSMGNISANPNSISTLSGWEDKSNYKHIRDITDSLLETGNYGEGIDLDYTTDIAGLSSGTEDYAKSQLIEIQKDIRGQGVTLDQFQKFLDNNQDLKNAYHRYAIDVDALWTDNVAESLYGPEPVEESESAKLIKLKEYFSPDDDYEGYQTIHNDTSEYGGGTYFKSNISDPDEDDVENKKILLKAIGKMRDWEVDQGNWWQLDDMWLEQRGDDW